MQKRLSKAEKRIKYTYGAFNVIDKKDSKIQVIRITEGCPNNCPYCYEPKKVTIYDIPTIIRNNVRIIDMNLLSKRNKAKEIIKDLGLKRVNNKVVYYELVCGIDYRFMDQEFADLLKQNRFIKIRLAWDWEYTEQRRIKNTINLLKKAGYKSKNINIFMICNWLIPFEQNCNKLDLCKVWSVKAVDCYFDNQLSPNILPIYWKAEQIKTFRRMVRKHNQLIGFGIDPEVK